MAYILCTVYEMEITKLQEVQILYLNNKWYDEFDLVSKHISF